MITKYGMDEELGTLQYAPKEGASEYQMYKPYSEKTAEIIDKKVQTLVADAYTRSKAILSANKSVMEHLVAVLYEKEYLTKEEFESVMKNPDQ